MQCIPAPSLASWAVGVVGCRVTVSGPGPGGPLDRGWSRQSPWRLAFTPETLSGAELWVCR